MAVDLKPLFTAAEDKMKGAITALVDHDFKTLRTGRASTALVEGLRVEVYGTPTPIQQVAALSTPDPRTIVVSPWDKSNIKAIEHAILEANLGVNPQNDGKVIRLMIPPLTEDRRKELVKKAHAMTEDHRVAVRNVRRHTKEEIEKRGKPQGKKPAELTEDEVKKANDQLQKLTDSYIKKLDEAMAKKEKEIMEI